MIDEKKKLEKELYKTIVFDCEFTGLDVNSDEIIQLSIINDNGKVLFDHYFKPEKKEKWEETYEIHNITPELVANEKHFSYYKEELQEIFDTAEKIVGYGTEMDLEFLSKSGIKIDENKIIDVGVGYAELYNQWNNYFENYKMSKLIDCAESYGFDFDKFELENHNSLADSIITLYCYKQLVPEAEEHWIEKYNDKVNSIVYEWISDIDEETIKGLIDSAILCDNSTDFKFYVGYEEWMDEWLDDNRDDELDEILSDIYEECEELKMIKSKIQDYDTKGNKENLIATKLNKEFEEYKENLKSKDKDYIIDRSFETHYKYNLVITAENMEFSQDEVDALLSTDNLLGELYNQWLEYDGVDEMEGYFDSLTNSKENILNYFKSKNISQSKEIGDEPEL